MSEQPKPSASGGREAGQGGAPAFAVDEPQPSSAIGEHDALSEREDGTNHAGSDPALPPQGQPIDAAPTIILTADEQQPISPVDEYNARSEREDGTNRG